LKGTDRKLNFLRNSQIRNIIKFGEKLGKRNSTVKLLELRGDYSLAETKNGCRAEAFKHGFKIYQHYQFTRYALSTEEVAY